MKASDVTDEMVVAAIRTLQRAGREIHGRDVPLSLWDIQDSLPDTPPKVVTAKLASMVKRGILAGTARNGDRGDFSLVGSDDLNDPAIDRALAQKDQENEAVYERLVASM